MHFNSTNTSERARAASERALGYATQSEALGCAALVQSGIELAHSRWEMAQPGEALIQRREQTRRVHDAGPSTFRVDPEFSCSHQSTPVHPSIPTESQVNSARRRLISPSPRRLPHRPDPSASPLPLQRPTPPTKSSLDPAPWLTAPQAYPCT